MADNLSDRFATMSEEERRRSALKEDRAGAGNDDERTGELDFDDPRNDPGPTKANLEDRDGAAALLDQRQHEDRVRKESQSRDKQDRAPE